MSTSSFDHSEERLRTLRRHTPVAAVNLYNAGLGFPGCVTAYQAALFCGASAEVAFEAARNHMLAELPRLQPGHYSTYERMAGRHLRDHERIAARDEQIARVRALPNPFAVQQMSGFGAGQAAGNESSENASLAVAA